MTVEIFNLSASESIPSTYEDYLTEGERFDHIRRTAKGLAGLPILHDVPAKTRRSFATWSLFLISNPAWLGPDAITKIRSLYDSYRSFAFAIGGRHAAVWFGRVWPEDAPPDPKQPPLQIDTNRCAEYSAKLGLNLAESPHVVVTTKYPSLNDSLGDAVVLSLNGLSAESTTTLLTHLATQLVSAKLDQVELNSERWWLTWRDVATQVFQAAKHLVDYASFTIRTGIVNFTIQGSKAAAAKKSKDDKESSEST